MIARVFPRRTALTPTDDYAFVGQPPLFRPADITEVLVSVAFTWDKAEGEILKAAWGQYYKTAIGGPTFGDSKGWFAPGVFVKRGVTFTSRGCNNRCPFCLVPEREGKLQVIPIRRGHIINDNNFLQCPPMHRVAVYQMLNQEKRSGIFAGGLDASLITDEISEELRGLRIASVFLASDTQASEKALQQAVRRLSFLSRDKLRCYALLAYSGETPSQAEARLERLWEIGVLPFAQLYQPADKWIDYSREWRSLARTWSRPAAMKSLHKVTR